MKGDVSLVPADEKLYKKIIEWHSNKEIQEKVGFLKLKKEITFNDVIGMTNQMFLNQQGMVLGALKEKRYIGYVYLTKIDRVNLSVEAHPFIGKISLWNKGYGITMLNELKKVIFDDMKLHRFYTFTTGYDDKMNRLLKRTGFKLEGIFTDAIKTIDGFSNSYVYGYTKNGG